MISMENFEKSSSYENVLIGKRTSQYESKDHSHLLTATSTESDEQPAVTAPAFGNDRENDNESDEDTLQIDMNETIDDEIATNDSISAKATNSNTDVDEFNRNASKPMALVTEF